MATKVAIVAFTTYVLLLAAAPPANSEHRGFRATMIRREQTINFARAAQQSQERLSMLAARLDAAASTQTPLRSDGAGAYDMEVSIGTPPQKLMAAADTGSDLIWAKCGPCTSCTPQGSPSYDPTKSSSFSKLPCSDRLCKTLVSQNQATCAGGSGPTGSDGGGGGDDGCNYHYSYGLSDGGHHYTQGYMGNETFTLGSDAAPGVGFGCTTMSEGNYGKGSGLVGLGRGPLSLVSQLGAGAFSYCLVGDTSKASPLLFGSMATLTGAGVQSTRLLDSYTFYAVDLKSISVGSTATPGGDVVFDSGTTLTYLKDPAYSVAKAAIMAQTTLAPVAARNGFDTCFRLPSDNEDLSKAIPTMVLHFDGADMELKNAANYFVEVESGVICWVVQSSTSLSLIGNIMQMNFHVRHDLDKKVLSFQPADCSKL